MGRSLARTATVILVSIPMTVLGGLQYLLRIAWDTQKIRVSIPMTVLGGLQSHKKKFHRRWKAILFQYR